jgi:hypothetical protein
MIELSFHFIRFYIGKTISTSNADGVYQILEHLEQLIF